MPLTFHALILPERKCINLEIVCTLLYSTRVLRLSKKRNLSFDGREVTAWSIAKEISLRLSGVPMNKQSFFFCTAPPDVLVIASIKIIKLMSIPLH